MYNKQFTGDNWHRDAKSIAVRNSIRERRWGMRVTVFTNPANPALTGDYVLEYNQTSTSLQDNGNWLKVADIGATWGGGGVTGADNGLHLNGTLGLSVYIIARHQRSTLARVSGDTIGDESLTADPGVETIAEHVIERLAGQSLSVPCCGLLRCSAENMVQFDGEVLIWQLVFSVDTDSRINPNRSITLLAESIEMYHRIVSPNATERVTDPGPIIGQLIEDENV